MTESQHYEYVNTSLSRRPFSAEGSIGLNWVSPTFAAGSLYSVTNSNPAL